MGIHRFLKAIGAYTLPDEDIAAYEELTRRPRKEIGQRIDPVEASESPAEQDRRNQPNIANKGA